MIFCKSEEEGLGNEKIFRFTDTFARKNTTSVKNKEGTIGIMDKTKMPIMWIIHKKGVL